VTIALLAEPFSAGFVALYHWKDHFYGIGLTDFVAEVATGVFFPSSLNF
jgi:hypothetical protein